MSQYTVGVNVKLSFKDLAGQVKKLQQELEKQNLEVKMNVGKDLEKGFEGAKKKAKETGETFRKVKVDMDKLAKMSTNIVSGKAVSRTLQLNTGIGETLKLVQKVSQKTGDWVTSNKRVLQVDKVRKQH